jgi:hypothetical protein
MGRDVPEVRSLREQWLQRVAIWCVVQVPDNGNHVDALRPSQIVDFPDPLSLSFSARVRLSFRAETLALQVVHQEQDTRGFVGLYCKLRAVAAENPVAILHVVDVTDYRFDGAARLR